MKYKDFEEKFFSRLTGLEKALSRNEEEFRSLWEANASPEEFFWLAQKAGTKIKLDSFLKGWQYRTVLHPDYNEAKTEFLNLCFGWW